MLLNIGTQVFVVSKKDGEMSRHTLNGWFLALNGGSRWEDVEVTTDAAEADKLRRKYMAIGRMVHLMQHMTKEQVEKTVDLVQAREDLMDVAEAYQ